MANKSKYSRRRNSSRRRGVHGRKRNPQLFGSNVNSLDYGKGILGGLVGVAAVRFITPLLPGSLRSNPIVSLLAQGGIALGAGFIAGKMVSPTVSSAVSFGGMMAAASSALSMITPLRSLALGDWVPGAYTVPQMPVSAPVLLPPAAPSNL